MSRKLALVQWSKTLAVLLIIAGLQILLLDVALFIAYFVCISHFSLLQNIFYILYIISHIHIDI